jgi:hypothetical protein
MSNSSTATRSIFAEVFADQWEHLPAVMKTHYANRPGSHDRVVVEGRLNVRIHPLMRPFAGMMATMGLLTPWAGDDVPCRVQFLSQPDGSAFIFDRQFRFPGRKRYRFRSELVAKGPHDVIEYMNCGIGWRCGCGLEGGRIVLRHRGYVWRLFGRDVPLPGAGLIVGRGEAWEEPVDDHRFAMFMALRHPMLGLLYSYGSTFTVTETQLD